MTCEVPLPLLFVISASGRKASMELNEDRVSCTGYILTFELQSVALFHSLHIKIVRDCSLSQRNTACSYIVWLYRHVAGGHDSFGQPGLERAGRSAADLHDTGMFEKAASSHARNSKNTLLKVNSS